MREEFLYLKERPDHPWYPTSMRLSTVWDLRVSLLEDMRKILTPLSLISWKMSSVCLRAGAPFFFIHASKDVMLRFSPLISDSKTLPNQLLKIKSSKQTILRNTMPLFLLIFFIRRVQKIYAYMPCKYETIPMLLGKIKGKLQEQLKYIVRFENTVVNSKHADK